MDHRIEADWTALQPEVILLESAPLPGRPMDIGQLTTGRRRLLTVASAVLFGLLLSSPPAILAKEGRIYKVHGTVVAVTLNQTPPLIVVNTPLSPKNHMTVGATVTPHTRILRGDRKIALQTIKEGESVWLTYVKLPNGLEARTIKVKG